MFDYYRGASFTPPSGNIFKEVVQDFYFFIQACLTRLDYFREMNYSFDSGVISEDWDWQLWFSRNYNIYGTRKCFASYRWLETSIGRTNWTEEKIHRVLMSQARMLLKYYDHPKNTRADRKAVYARVERIYMEMLAAPKAGAGDKLTLFLHIMRTTGQWRLPAKMIKTKLTGLWR